jgi:hypothetical protein
MAQRSFPLTMWLLLFGLATSFGADPEPVKFFRDLFHVNFPMHVISEGEANDPVGFSGKVIPTRMKFAPTVAHPSNILRPPVYDATGTLKGWGLNVPPGSIAHYSPSSQLLFVSLPVDDLDLLKLPLDGPGDRIPMHTFDVRVSTQADQKEKLPIFEAKSVGIKSGQLVELHLHADATVDLKIEPVIGPDGELMDLNIEALVEIQGKSMSVKSTFLTNLSKPLAITLGKLDGKSVVFEFQPHRQFEYTGPAETQTEAAKAKAIAVIRAAMEGK